MVPFSFKDWFKYLFKWPFKCSNKPANCGYSNYLTPGKLREALSPVHAGRDASELNYCRERKIKAIERRLRWKKQPQPKNSR